MRELILLAVISGLVFLVFLLILVLGFKRRDNKLKLMALLLFFVFIGLTAWTGFKFVSKTYSKVTETLKPRTGDEIYDALFGNRQTNCVKVLNYQDQVVPKVDYAIWLHFETCPTELKRILSRHQFSREKLSKADWHGKVPNDEVLEWFKPTTLGDTILIYEYSTYDSQNIQTIWTNLDSTKVFVRDIFD